MVNTQAKHSYADLSAKTEEEDVVLGQLLQVIMDDIWLLLGIAVTVVALAGLYCYIAKPVYQADVHVRVEGNDNTSQALTQTQTGAMINSGPQQAPTDAEIEIIKSRGVVAPVVEQFKLNFSVVPKTLPVIGGVAARIATPGVPAKPWLGLKSYAWGGEVADVDSISVVPALEGKKLTLTAGPNGTYSVVDQNGMRLLSGQVGEAAQGAGLAGAVDDLADDAAGEPAVDDLEAVGLGVVDVQLLGDGTDDLDEAPGDQGHGEAQPLEGAHEGAGTGGEDHRLAHAVLHRHRAPVAKAPLELLGELAVVLAEDRGELALEELGDRAGAVGELLLDVLGRLLELGLDEFGVRAGLLAVEHACPDHERVAHGLGRIVARLLALAHEPNGAFVLHVELADDEAVADHGHVGLPEWSRSFHGCLVPP